MVLHPLSDFVVKWVTDTFGRMEFDRNVRIANLLHFTEHHRFSVHRDFALSALQGSMLTHMYQPMVGMAAVGLYYTLYRQVAEQQIGYSPLEQHRRVLLLTGSEGETGRREWLEHTSRLEAVGLLKTQRHYAADSEEYVYVYRLSAPLDPLEFFRNQHLTLLLRDKIGKYMLLALKSEMLAAEPAELAGTQSEDLSMPFYELFRLNAYAVDPELEPAFEQTAAAKQSEAPAAMAAAKGFDYADIIGRFPRSSRNRPFVENLKFEKDQLSAINYVVRKYSLGLAETCRLLNEDDVFREDGTLDIDFLQHKANLDYLQGRQREEQRTLSLARSQEAKLAADAAGDARDVREDKQEQVVEMEYYLEVPELLQGQCNVHQYNFILRNEPYTFVVQKYFSGGIVPKGVLDMLAVLNLTYKLNEEVLNVLLHYSHVTKRSWSRSSLEQVASDMLGRQVETYEQAVQFVRERLKLKMKLEAKEKAAAENGGGGQGHGGGGARGGAGRSRGGSSGGAGAVKPKPQIPVAPIARGNALSDEKRQEIRQVARELDEVFNKRNE